MSLFSRHLDAAALGLTLFDDALDTRTGAHLASCPRCRRERDRMAVLLAEAREGAADAADAAFSAADLDRQRQAIMLRLARTGGVARVLRFPHSADERPQTPPRVDTRWLAAAAAAGLLLGVAAGHVPRPVTGPGENPAVAPHVVASTPTAPDGRGDDTLLSEVDAALTSRTRPELGALDALTPIHYETR